MIYLSYDDTNKSRGGNYIMKKLLLSNSKIEKLGFLGFLGFMGFLKSFQGEPQYIFFSFFGFFSYFFIGYTMRETADERMIHNIQKARESMLKFYSIILSILMIFIILNGNILHIKYVDMKVIELVVAILFAFSLVLNSALIYYYDRIN